ncbi:DUF2531 family protein [Pluralibacter gergoviae]
MTAERRIALLMLLLLPVLTAMRDPFRPPEDRCRTAELSRWRYGGALGMAPQLTGFVQNAAGQWRRVKEGMPLEGGRKVRKITPDRLEIALNEGCDTPSWHWRKEGPKRNEQESAGGRAAARLVYDDSERERATRDAERR